ncbi:hypothetical protein CHS0354_006641 [Potamilus streckersoni]|uniref:WW domain-binding protein 4 n=1 Tax=Potamilus streckersoni TaxID=2493646 RepID=A0AAE0SWI2_9BIVA|nr:hypothetical protein CHS0354_006641 [Potamilus streckersoni]
MTSYWKSQPKKFCDFCKCWITDNKPSVEFHEKGKRHQENVKRKIDDVRKKSIDNAKKKEEENDYMKQMEKAALAAFKKDLEQNPELAAHYKAKIKEKKEKDKKGEEKSSDTSVQAPAEPQLATPSEIEWYEALSPEGYTYYWNTVTSESVWEPPPKYVSLVEQGLAPPSQEVEEKGDQSTQKDDTDGSDLSTQRDDTDGSNLSTQSDDTDDSDSSKDNTTTNNDADTNSNTECRDAVDTITQEVKIEDIPMPPGLEDIPLPEEVTSQPAHQSESSESEEEDTIITPKQDRGGRAVYGQWSTVRKPEQVDLELPEQQEIYESIPIPRVTEEPRMKFKEKRVTSLGSNSKAETVTFKKRKLGSGARNVRQRDNDD